MAHSERPNLGVFALTRMPHFWLGLIALGLGSVLYYPLVLPDYFRPVDIQSEHFFFEPNSSAAVPVLLLSLWLFIRRSHYRDVLHGPGSPALGTLVLLLSGALFGWGVYTGADDIRLATLIPLLAGVVLQFAGPSGIRAFWLPILFLGFALPISPVVVATTIFPMQLWTAQFAGSILNTIGFESLVVGDQILRPENTFLVIETCSGFRTVLTLSMLTILLIDLFERRGLHAAILIGLAPIVAFMINALRVVTLVLNPYSSIHSIHNLQGILMLLAGLLLIYFADTVIERVIGSRDPIASNGDYGLIRTGGSTPRANALAWLTIVLVLVTMYGIDRFTPRWAVERIPAEEPGALLARVFGDDPSSPYGLDYNFVGSVHYLARARHRIEVDGAIVEIHLGIANEQQREYSILSKRLAWPGSGLQPIEESSVDYAGGPLTRRMVLRRGSRFVLSYSGIARRNSFLSEWFRQAFALDRSLFGRPDHMLGLRISTPLPIDESQLEQAEARIQHVWEQLAPQLESYARIR